MASSRRSLATNIRECPVCLDDMTKKNPKLLSCKHSFCTPCLSRLEVANRKRPGLNIQCPKCRHNTVVQSGKLSDLPDNFLLRELQAALDEQVRCPYCFYCNKLDKETKAVSQCMDCRRYLCEDCLDKHKKTVQFEDHEIRSFREKEKKVSEICSKHNETALYVCKACTPIRLLCDVCLTIEDPCHTSEVFIDYSEALSELQSKVKLELSKKRNFDEKLSKVNSEKQMMIDKVQDNASTFIKSIEATRDEIISQIERSFDTTSLKFAVNAVKVSQSRVKELAEKDDKKVTELSEGAAEFNNKLHKLSDEEERVISFDSNMLSGVNEELFITGTGGTQMKLKLIDLASIKNDSEDLPPKEETLLRRPETDAAGKNSTKTLKKNVPISADPKTLNTDFQIGSLVEVTVSGAAEYGVIRWFGFYGYPDKPIVGIEMEEERDHLTDGTYMTKKLFECPPRKASFTFLTKCKPDSRSNESTGEYL